MSAAEREIRIAGRPLGKRLGKTKAAVICAAVFGLALAMTFSLFTFRTDSGSDGHRQREVGSATNSASTLPDVWPYTLSANSPSDDELISAQESPDDTITQLLVQLHTCQAEGTDSQATAGVAAEVPDAASSLLGAYQAGSTCLLAYEGYLDLTGEAWGCVVEGEGWVDVAVVQAREDEGSQVSIIRMNVEEWTDNLQGEVWDEN